MNILVINAGSSSIKYQVFNAEEDVTLLKGLIERIGQPGSCLTQKVNGDISFSLDGPFDDFESAFHGLKDAIILDPQSGISNIHDIKAVGHRVVHGGESFSTSICIDDKVIAGIEQNIMLAPLHNPANLSGIKASMALLDVPNVAVFDTAFYVNMPKQAYLYGLPYHYYSEKKIRKYGFHGISHQYVADRAAALVKKDSHSLNVITCHLGNGASITAIKNGQAIDTSMGFTPLEGVLMGTRSGDIDPAVIFFLMQKEGLSLEEVNDLLNKKSGLLGVSGISNDIRDIKSAAEEGNEQARLALEVYAYRIRKYIGAFVAALEGVDVIVFTAGIGENNIFLWDMICQPLQYLDVFINQDAKLSPAHEKIITTPESTVKVCVIPTNEELMIARDTYKIVK